MTVISIVKLFINLPDTSTEQLFSLPYTGLILGATCLLQFAVCFFMERKYDRGLLSIYLAIIWYPIFYWLLNWIVSMIAFPKAMFFSSGKKRGRWHTTDRGINSRKEDNATS